MDGLPPRSLGFCCFQSSSFLILNIGLFVHDLDFLRVGKRHLPAKASVNARGVDDVTRTSMLVETQLQAAPRDVG